MSFPAPEITDINQPYWDGLAAGRLLFQHCETCSQDWLPPRAACPRCLSPQPGWRQAAGTGRVISWVVYHRAYADHLKERVPYDVTLVELDEGVRILTNIVDCNAGKSLTAGARVQLAIEIEEGFALARFKLCADDDGEIS